MNTTESNVRYPGGLLMAGLVLALASAACSTYFALKFGRLFDDFGAELPLLTTTVVQFYWVVWFLPLAVLLVSLISKDPDTGGQRSFVLGLFGGVFMGVLVVVAMYLPVMSMGVMRA